MPANTAYYFINNQILPASEAGLLLNDLGLFRAYGIFDYFRTQQGEPLFMQHYLQRFRHSASLLRLSLKLQDQELEAVIRELLELNGREESGIRLLLTGGYSENMFTPAEPNLIIRIEKSALPDARTYADGVKLISAEYLRDFPEVKTTNYLKAIQLWPGVEAAGATELLYHWKGEWLECSRSNFFVIADGILLTPPLPKVLAGVTRKKVIELAHDLGIKVEERSLPLNIIRQAEEAFITGTTKKVMPVVQIDDVQIGNGRPGNKTQKLLEAWQELESSFKKSLV